MGAKLHVRRSVREINRQIIRFAAGKKLAFDPGEKYEYSSTNYILLGLIIEFVSGKEAGDFFEKEFFTPLGMKNTRLGSLEETLQQQKDPESIGAPSRYFILPTGGKPKFNVAKHRFTMISFTDGGVASTTDDLIIWQKALHSGKVLSSDSYKKMTTGYYSIACDIGVKSKIGYGLYLTELENGDELYHHPGMSIGVRSESGCILKKNIFYAVLSNVINVISYAPKRMQKKVDQTDKANHLDIIHFTNHVLNSI
jgi:CubicO group peptidase (beta-lactamase class C family)